MNFTVLRFDTVASTNTEATDQARRGADEGLCIIARQQTAGRGRHGRTWISEAGAGLYLSVVLRPKIDPRLLTLITLMAGIAVFDALTEFGLKPDIKWANDVLIGDRKISGILSETVDTAKGVAVIVGIGINLTSRNFPEEIAFTATSIEAEAKRMPDAIEVEAAVLKYIDYWYAVLREPDGADEVRRNWQQRSSYFTGKEVRVMLDGHALLGITDGLEPNGALRVKRSDGSVSIIHAGDVERLRAL